MRCFFGSGSICAPDEPIFDPDPEMDPGIADVGGLSEAAEPPELDEECCCCCESLPCRRV